MCKMHFCNTKYVQKHILFFICIATRRDTIVTRGDAQSKLKKNTVTKGTFERQMGELRKKIKQTINVSYFQYSCS